MMNITMLLISSEEKNESGWGTRSTITCAKHSFGLWNLMKLYVIYTTHHINWMKCQWILSCFNLSVRQTMQMRKWSTTDEIGSMFLVVPLEDSLSIVWQSQNYRLLLQHVISIDKLLDNWKMPSNYVSMFMTITGQHRMTRFITIVILRYSKR